MSCPAASCNFPVLLQDRAPMGYNAEDNVGGVTTALVGPRGLNAELALHGSRMLCQPNVMLL
jgi:hypothetical protein